MRKYIGKLRTFLKRLFCRHDYVKTGWKEIERNNLRASIRFYVCEKCGKFIRVPGWDDPYAR